MKMAINNNLKEQVLKKANYKCSYCGVKLNKNDAHIDHIYPKSKGGIDHINNLTASCKLCNISKSNKIIDFVTTPISKQAATAWIHAYKESPKITVWISSLLSIISILMVFYFNNKVNEERQKKFAENINFTSQIGQLNQTEENLNKLISFVKFQKQQLIINEETIEILKKEKNKLEPLVQADKKIIKSLFLEQETRAKKEATTERWIGFGLGLLASLIASIFILIIQFFIKKGNKRIEN